MASLEVQGGLEQFLNDCKILSWIIRGANDNSKRKVIKALLRSQRLDLFRLQETEIHLMFEGIVRGLGTGWFLD